MIINLFFTSVCVPGPPNRRHNLLKSGEWGQTAAGFSWIPIHPASWGCWSCWGQNRSAKTQSVVDSLNWGPCHMKEPYKYLDYVFYRVCRSNERGFNTKLNGWTGSPRSRPPPQYLWLETRAHDHWMQWSQWGRRMCWKRKQTCLHIFTCLQSMKETMILHNILLKSDVQVQRVEEENKIFPLVVRQLQLFELPVDDSGSFPVRCRLWNCSRKKQHHTEQWNKLFPLKYFLLVEPCCVRDSCISEKDENVKKLEQTLGV